MSSPLAPDGWKKLAERSPEPDAAAPDLEMALEEELIRARRRIAALEAELREARAGMEARVRERTRELEQRVTELDAFSRTVSHDLLAPIRHIRGFSDLLRQAASGNLPARAERALDAIVVSADKASQLVHALLQLARSGHQALDYRTVPLGTLVEEVRRELSAEVGSRQVEWTLSPLPQVRGDAQLLRQALHQLLANALKYTRHREVARIEVGAGHAGDSLVLHVRDNGAGFDMAQASKLFNPFQRLHPESQFEGNGVGLATVRRIAERHGGRVWAEALPDAGATFYLSLPWAEDARRETS